jgi:hypothetical protein
MRYQKLQSIHGTTLPHSWFVTLLSTLGIDDIKMKSVNTFYLLVDPMRVLLEKLYAGSSAGKFSVFMLYHYDDGDRN